MGQLDDVVDSEFFHDIGSVILNCAYRAIRLKSDFFVAHALHELLKDIVLSFSQDFSNRDILHRSFNEVLLEAETNGLLRLEADEKSGGYTVHPA